MKNRILEVNNLYNYGNKIIIFTARGMTKYSGNIDLVNKNLFEKTKNQLELWEVKYNELIMGKPSYDFIIDDKNILIEDFFKTDKKIGFIAGSFDIIHPGYIEMFQHAKKNCDYLIVGLHTDPTIERPNKMKPILSVDDRTKILSSIKFIDEIVYYDTEVELENILKEIKIDIRFLGDDYRNCKYTGSSLNIPVNFIDRSHGWSSTKLKLSIEKSINKK